MSGKKTLLLLAAALLAAASLLLTLRRVPDPDDPEPEVQAKNFALEWVRENAPTYKFDGMNLRISETRRRAPDEYDITLEFESRQGGYGDRTGKFLAQVITPHVTEVSVYRVPETGAWEVKEAVTDGVYDEKRGEFIGEDPSREYAEVNLYFVQVINGQEDIIPSEREVPLINGIERSALEALLEGPDEEESAEGYTTAINTGVEILEMEISGGFARVSFSSRLEDGVAGSATVVAIRRQIEMTLTQFDTVERVEIAVEGRTRDILQP